MDVFADVDVPLTDCATPPRSLISAPEVLGRRLPGVVAGGPVVLDAWTCGGGSAEFVRFADHPSVVVSYEDGWAGIDVEEKWSGFIRDVNPDAEVVEIGGLESLLDPAVTDDGLSQVMVVVGDTLVRVSGESDVPTDELLAAARDLQLK